MDVKDISGQEVGSLVDNEAIDSLLSMVDSWIMISGSL